MIGKSSLILIGMAAVAGAVLFETSFKVQGLEEDLAGINRQIVAEHDAIQVLRAEWSLLNDPTRLERLADHYLPLHPAEAKQYTALSAIPMRKATEPVVASAYVATAPAPDGSLMPLPRPKPGIAGTPARSAPPAKDDGVGVLIARLGAGR